MTICVPPGTDWGCAYTDEELAEMRADPAILAVMERSEALAWMSLAALTADQIGTCPITVRPCRAGCGGPDVYLTAPVGTSGHYAGVLPGRFGLSPYVGAGGMWVNSCGCSSPGDCSCTALCEAILPGPVGDIVEVLLHGAVLDPTSYRVDNGDRLVRIDGECWPACQDMSKPGGAEYEPVVVETASVRMTYTRVGQMVQLLVEYVGPGATVFASAAAYWPRQDVTTDIFSATGTPMGSFILNNDSGNTLGGGGTNFPPFTVTYETTDPPAPADVTGTFEVTYYRGAAPDAVLLWAAGLLAVEWYKACKNDKTCRLPRGVRNVSRQGVSYEVERNLFSEGTTGIPEVDAVVTRYNPYGLKMAPTISIPRRKTRQTTWSR